MMYNVAEKELGIAGCLSLSMSLLLYIVKYFALLHLLHYISTISSCMISYTVSKAMYIDINQQYLCSS